MRWKLCKDKPCGCKYTFPWVICPGALLAISSLLPMVWARGTQCLISASLPASGLWVSGWAVQVHCSSVSSTRPLLQVCFFGEHTMKTGSSTFKCVEYLTVHDKVNRAVVSTHFLFVIMFQVSTVTAILKTLWQKWRVRALP